MLHYIDMYESNVELAREVIDQEFQLLQNQTLLRHLDIKEPIASTVDVWHVIHIYIISTFLFDFFLLLNYPLVAHFI